MTEDDFFARHQPVKNHLDANAAFDGTMFETFGAELDYVLGIDRANPRRIATLIDGEEGMAIASGYHLVNRLGYFVLAEPFAEDFEVMLDDDGDDDDGHE
jgi:hypothetical protein